MRNFNHNLVLKTLKQVSFPLVSYVGHMDCLAFESSWKKRKLEKYEGQWIGGHVCSFVLQSDVQLAYYAVSTCVCCVVKHSYLLDTSG